MKEQKDRYEIFLKVCETGSFSKAAEALNYTQSGISQMMAGLEEELGVQLFARVKRTSCARPPSISTIRLRGNCGSVVFPASLLCGCRMWFIFSGKIIRKWM